MKDVMKCLSCHVRLEKLVLNVIVSFTILLKFTLTLTGSNSRQDSDPTQPASLLLINEVAEIETKIISSSKNMMSAYHYAVIPLEKYRFQDNIKSVTIVLTQNC